MDGTALDVDGAVCSIDIDGTTVTGRLTQNNAAVQGQAVTLLVRPEMIRLHSLDASGKLNGTVREIIYQGSVVRYRIQIGHQHVMVEVPNRPDLARLDLDDVEVYWNADSGVDAMKIGVDVQGTNTDAVVLGPNGVLGWRKTPTTADVYSGIVAAITHAIADASVDSADVDCVMIGTTQFTNAVIQRRSLLPVGIIRLALPATSAIPPLTDWPNDLITEIGRNAHLVGGGYEFDGREIAPLDEVAVAKAARSFRCDGIRTAAITSVFSPMNGYMERRAAEIVQNRCRT